MNNQIDEQIAAAEQRWKNGWAAGPTRLRWTALPPQIGDPAPDATLLDDMGTPTTLSSLWRERPLLLLFWRHKTNILQLMEGRERTIGR